MDKKIYSGGAERIVKDYYDSVKKDFQDIDLMIGKIENLDALKEIVEKEKEDQALKTIAIKAIGLIGGHTREQKPVESCLEFFLKQEKAANKETRQQIKQAIIHILEHIAENKIEIQTTLPEKYKETIEKIRNREQLE